MNVKQLIIPLLLLTQLARGAEDPKQVMAIWSTGRVYRPTNFWAGNSNDLNAVVAKQLPAGGATGQALTKASGADWDLTWSTITGGGGGAPTSASYLVLGVDGTLTSERVFTPGTGLSYSDAGAGGAYTVSVSYGTTSGTAAQGNDSRLSDARTPTAHTHGLADITDEGTAASRNVPATGNASATEVVLGSDTRLSDARTPTTHSHNWLVPAGGSTDQVLAKASATDGDLKWATAASGSSPTTTRGDLIKRGASVDERLGIASVVGSVLLSDGTDPFWMTPRNGFCFFEDFLTYTSTSSTTQFHPWVGNGSSGALATLTGESSHPGILRLGTSTSASGSQSIGSGAQSTPPFIPGSGLIYHAALLRFPTASDDTESFLVRCGVAAATYAMPGNGCWFEYTHNTNSAKWQIWVAKASNYYFTDSGVTASANTWYLLEITVAADGASAVFAVTPAGGSTTTVSYSTSANMPTGAIGYTICMVKRAGPTQRYLDVDCAWVYHRMTNNRW